MPEYTFDVSQMQNGEMKRVEIEGKPVILACVDGQYHAFRGTCSHYGGPLDEGVLHGHTVMCPWHHACFDIRSGERLEPPALNDIPTYDISVNGGQASVTFPHTGSTDPQGKAEPDEQRVFVIVGGGAAGEAAAEELRRSHFRGKIVLISSVPETPIDRPNLSKDYLDGHAKPEWIPLRDEKWYAARDIELHRNTRVTGIDPQAHTVKSNNDTPLHYDKLLLATGATPRKLPVPGADLAGVYTLRSLDDASQLIQEAEKGTKAVVIGASFIGTEVAASLASGRGVSVTLVDIDAVPLARVLGERIGKVFQIKHADNGVQFRMNSGIEAIIGENGRVTGVQLKSGERLAADFVVMGVGVVPATEFLQDAGLEMNGKDHAVMVNQYLQTSNPNIYAAGDIARWNTHHGDARVEHWRVAQQQGIVAARNMLNEREDINGRVPFFWTNQWKFGITYVGRATEWDDIIFRGEPENENFVAFYVKGGKLLAAAGFNQDKDMAALEFILREGLNLTPDQMRDEGYDLVKHATGR